MPKAPKITIQESLRVSVLDLLDIFSALESSSDIHGRTRSSEMVQLQLHFVIIQFKIAYFQQKRVLSA